MELLSLVKSSEKYITHVKEIHLPKLNKQVKDDKTDEEEYRKRPIQMQVTIKKIIVHIPSLRNNVEKVKIDIIKRMDDSDANQELLEKEYHLHTKEILKVEQATNNHTVIDEMKKEISTHALTLITNNMYNTKSPWQSHLYIDNFPIIKNDKNESLE